MDNNFLTALLILPLLLLIAWLVIRDNEDRKKFRDQLNSDYKKSKDSEKDIHIDLKED